MDDTQTANRIRVLFVDDEPMLLQGLKRMLRGQRDVWDMDFVSSAGAALDYMQQTSVDVVVSDMRMPEMDGAALLDEVSRRHPEAIRLVLSGYAENEAVLKTIGPSHQYLAKPCDAEVLISTVQRSLKLRQRLSSPELLAFVTGLTALPSAPAIYQDFIATVGKWHATSESISDIIERDVGLTTTILKLTNSAYFSLPMKILNCRQAIQLLGLDTIRSLVAAATLFRAFEGSSVQAAILNAMCDDALALAALARKIAEAEGFPSDEADRACCAGLLAHVGILMFLVSDAASYYRVIKSVQKGDASTLEAERAAFGASHVEAGAYLLALWGFADPIVEAVLHHHNPLAAETGAFDLIGAVHVAEALLPPRFGAGESGLDQTYIDTFGKGANVAAWRDMGARLLQKGAPL